MLPGLMRKLTSESKDKKRKIEEGKFMSFIPRPKEPSNISDDSGDDCSATQTESWKSCEGPGYHDHAPLVTQQVLYSQQEKGGNIKIIPESRADEQRNLNITMASAAQLPKHSFASNHIMVNRVRSHRSVPPLSRSPDLDRLARWHAENMASAAIGACHADPAEIQARLAKPSRRIGSNVAVGESIRHIHGKMMEKRGDFNNMIDRRYSEMGMGTAKGPDGELYLCQIYRG